MAEECVSLIPGIKELLADKAYDTNAIRTFLKEHGIKAVIPSKSNRKKKISHDKQAYKNRNVVERCFCRLKDWRASPRDTTSSPKISFLLAASSQPWPSGFERIESGA